MYCNVITLLVICLSVTMQLAAEESTPPVASQWKSSIERPTKGWDYDGKRILGHIDHEICLWDAATGQILHRMKDHQERIQKVEFSPDGRHAVSSSWISDGPMTNLKSRDTRTILWDLLASKSKQVLPGQVAGEFSSDGARFVTFSQRATGSSSFDAKLWEVSSGRELVHVALPDGSGPYFDNLHFSPDGTRFVYLHSRGTVQFDCRDGREVGRIIEGSGILRYTSTGALACFELGREAGRISIIDIESGRTLQNFEHGASTERAWKGAWAHNGRRIAAFPTDGKIKIWDSETGTAITGAQGGQYPQHHAIVSPDNSRLAISWGGGSVNNKEIDPMVGMYDLGTGAEICVIEVKKTGYLIGFSPDSKSLLIVGPSFEIYNSVNGRRIRSLPLESFANP